MQLLCVIQAFGFKEVNTGNIKILSDSGLKFNFKVKPQSDLASCETIRTTEYDFN